MDEELIPTIGEHFEPGDEERVYFQDIDSFNRSVRYDGVGDGEIARFQTGSKHAIGHVITFEHALDALLKCALRRQELRQVREICEEEHITATLQMSSRVAKHAVRRHVEA